MENARLGTVLSKENWSQIYKIIFTTTDDASIWFQYKSIYNILATQSYLFNLKITDSSICGICGNSVETIQHLFTQCNPVQELWSNVNGHKKKLNNVLYEINKLFLYLVQDQNFFANEFHITINKRIYILVCQKHLKTMVKERYFEQKIYINNKL